MARKRHTAEEIVAKLRQVDVLSSQGRPIADAIRAIGVTEVTYYRWRNEYGGLKGDQVKRLKELESLPVDTGSRSAFHHFGLRKNAWAMNAASANTPTLNTTSPGTRAHTRYSIAGLCTNSADRAKA